MLAYDIVDVFTDRPFAGNQLAVVHGADDLDAEQCLSLAQEFNFSETTFPSSAVVGAAEYSTRIFTPGGEIPFAGHPTLGTAWVLRSRGLLTATHVTQVCAAGRIGVSFAASGGHVELSAAPRDLRGPLDEDLVASLLGDLGLSASDAAGPAWVAGCGLTFVHIPVVADAVARALPSRTSLRGYAERFSALTTAPATALATEPFTDLGDPAAPVEGVNLVHVSGSEPTLTVHARVFVLGLSVAEDPATGSAAVGLGVALVASGRLPDGGAYDITQGVEMGRPSALHGRVDTTLVAGHGWRPDGTDVDGGPVAAMCHVGGQVQHVGHGEIAVPLPG